MHALMGGRVIRHNLGGRAPWASAFATHDAEPGAKEQAPASNVKHKPSRDSRKHHGVAWMFADRRSHGIQTEANAKHDREKTKMPNKSRQVSAR